MKRKKTLDSDIVVYPNGMFYFRRGAKEISLKTKDFKEAVQRKRILESRGDTMLSMSLKITFKDVVPFYLDARLSELKSGKIRERTYKECVDVLNWYLMPFFKNKSVAKADAIMWEEFKKSKLPRDLMNIRKVFSHLVRWCVKNGYKKDLLLLDIDKVERRQRRILKPYEIEAIWLHSHGSLKIFVALALTMGLRRTEIMTLKWDRVNFIDRALFLPKEITKTKKSRWVPLSEPVYALLKDRVAGQVDDGVRTPWVFPHLTKRGQPADKDGLKTAWRTCLRHAFNVPQGETLPNITWHDLRATCEYYAHKRTDISNTQLEKFFGSSVDVQRKIYVSMDAEDLRGVENSLLLQDVTKALGKTRGNE
jgi:integrase